MAVPIENYTWQQGEDLTISLQYAEGPDGQEVPIDLTGWKLRMDVVDGQTRLFTFNSDDIAEPGVDVVGPADNEAVLGTDGNINITVQRGLTLPGGVLFDLVEGGTSTFNFDIFLRRPNGKQFPILRGTIMVEKSYTLWL